MIKLMNLNFLQQMLTKRLLNSKCYVLRTFILFLTLAQSQAFAAVQKQEITINSKVVSHALQFDVFLPDGYKNSAEIRYPILLTSAGQSRLPILLEQVSWSSHTSFSPMPKVIIVTLPDVNLGADQDKFTGASGELDRVTTEVLKKDVLPYVDERFNTQPFRIIEGFSSWGNLPLYVFKNSPELFNAYFVFSPALELDKTELVRSFSGFSADKQYRHKFLYLSLGTFAGNRDGFTKLNDVFKPQDGKNGFAFLSDDLSNINYLSGPLIGLDTAATELFSDLNPNMERFNQSGISGLKQYYLKLEEKYGYPLDMEGGVIDLGFHFADSKKVDKALETMAHIVDHKSNNALLLIRLASVEQRAGLKNAALRTFKVALQVAQQGNDEEKISYIKNRITDLKGVN